MRLCWGSGEIVFVTRGEIMFETWPKIYRLDRVKVQVRACFSLVRSCLKLNRKFAGEIVLRFRWDRVWYLIGNLQVTSCWVSDEIVFLAGEIMFFAGEIVFFAGEIAFETWSKICKWDRVEVQVRSRFSLVISRLKLKRKFTGQIVLRFRWGRVFRWWDRVWNLTENLQVRPCRGSGEIVFCAGEIMFEIWPKICRWDCDKIQMSELHLKFISLHIHKDLILTFQTTEIVLRFRRNRVLRWWDRVWNLTGNLQVRSYWDSGDIDVYCAAEIVVET